MQSLLQILKNINRLKKTIVTIKMFGLLKLKASSITRRKKSKQVQRDK